MVQNILSRNPNKKHFENLVKIENFASSTGGAGRKQQMHTKFNYAHVVLTVNHSKLVECEYVERHQ